MTHVSTSLSMKTLVSVVCLITACVFTGCETTGPKTALGGAGGAAAGGLLAAALGGNSTGIAAGVLLGGLIGGAVGNQLDAADKRYARETTQKALETATPGTRVAWHNPDSGHSGTVTPTRDYRSEDGRECREYQQTVTVDGQQASSNNAACRQPSGDWVTVR